MFLTLKKAEMLNWVQNGNVGGFKLDKFETFKDELVFKIIFAEWNNSFSKESNKYI